MDTATQPLTEAPTDAEWEDHRRWAVPPIGTRRGMWVKREATELARREGVASARLPHYEAANVAIPN